MPELSRIAYVEDEPDIREVAGLALTEIGGFEVDVCASGQEAMERIPEFKPQLVLLDVMMPGMDGTEVLTQLRKLGHVKNVPVIFMTAKTRKEEVDRFLEIGAVAVIPKPFDPLILAGEIRSIWNATQP